MGERLVRQGLRLPTRSARGSTKRASEHRCDCEIAGRLHTFGKPFWSLRMSSLVASSFSCVPKHGLFWMKNRATLVVRGRDAKDFLHRMSTQHCSSMKVGEARLNVFTNKQGRIVDVVQQLQVSEDEILLLSALSSANALQQWLETFIFVEDVTFQQESNPQQMCLLAGEDSLGDATKWLGAETEIALHPWEMHRQGDKVVLRGFDLCGENGARVPCLWLFERTGHLDDIGSSLVELGVRQAEADTYQLLRIAAGVPEAPGEVSDKFNPLELQLHDAIHWDKGCYIGQEVISRIDNYGKQSRWIVGVIFESSPNEMPEAGAIIRTQNDAGEWQDAGALTSVSPIYTPNRPSALAWFKTKDFAASNRAELMLDGESIPVGLVQRAVAQTPVS